MPNILLNFPAYSEKFFEEILPKKKDISILDEIVEVKIGDLGLAKEMGEDLT